MVLGPNSQHITFFVTYEWTQQARTLDFARAERIVSDKSSNLLGRFVGYEEKKGCEYDPVFYINAILRQNG
jgi:hypothetical protein